MTEAEIVADLVYRLESIQDPPQAFGTGEGSESTVCAQSVAASILEKFLEFIRSNADSLPSKETVLDALEKAIDIALVASGRPIIVKIVGPLLKKQVLLAAGELYDRILGVQL